MVTISEAYESLQKKAEERNVLMEKLGRSFAIQELWADPKWPVVPYIAGSPSDGFYFYLRDSTGEKKKFELNEIPKALRTAPQIEKGLNHARRWKR